MDWKKTAKKAAIGAGVGGAIGAGYSFATDSDNMLLDVAVFAVVGATTPAIVDAIDEATGPSIKKAGEKKDAKKGG